MENIFLKNIYDDTENPCFFISDEEFTNFLISIDGLINGYFTNRDPIKDRGFFSVGNGWLGLIKILIEKLIYLDWDKQICQVKEKFGGLRFYTNGLTKEQHRIVNQYEALSYNVCEVCGKPGTQRRVNWIYTLCDEHAKEKNLI